MQEQSSIIWHSKKDDIIRRLNSVIDDGSKYSVKIVDLLDSSIKYAYKYYSEEADNILLVYSAHALREFIEKASRYCIGMLEGEMSQNGSSGGLDSREFRKLICAKFQNNSSQTRYEMTKSIKKLLKRHCDNGSFRLTLQERYSRMIFFFKYPRRPDFVKEQSISEYAEKVWQINEKLKGIAHLGMFESDDYLKNMTEINNILNSVLPE